MEPAHSVHFCTEFRERISASGLISPLGDFDNGRIIVLGKTYLTRQASTLLKFAKSTTDSELSAKLISKAADLKSQADPLPDTDQSLKAPDVDPEDQAGAP